MESHLFALSSRSERLEQANLFLGICQKNVFLKLFKPFSGHFLVINSFHFPQSHLQVLHFTAFLSRCKILHSTVGACAESTPCSFWCSLKDFFTLCKVRASDISWKKKAKFHGIFRGKFTEKPTDFRYFCGKKVKIHRKIG